MKKKSQEKVKRETMKAKISKQEVNIEDWRMKVRSEMRKWWEEEIKNQKEQKGKE